MKISHIDNHLGILEELYERESEPPTVGDVIKTHKSEMEGEVNQIKDNMVYFKTEDGRTFKTPINNIVVIQKLEDGMAGAVAGGAIGGRFGGIRGASAGASIGSEIQDRITSEDLNNGINRCRSSYDVNFGKVLDNEKELPDDVYESKWLNILEDFRDILQKQHDDDGQKRKKTADIPYNSWTIRYQIVKPGKPVEWVVIDKTRKVRHKGSSLSDKEAVEDAQNWIDAGAGTGKEATKNITIDFNIHWTREFAPEGETLYVMFDNDGSKPLIYLSLEPQQGFKRTHSRQRNYQQSVSLSAKEANEVGIVQNGRYVFGSKTAVDANTISFPLIQKGVTQGPTDRMDLGQPGFTAAHSRY